MNTFKDRAAQGEVFIRRIDTLPAGIVPAPIEDGNYVVGHSESGHHHVIPAVGVQCFVAPENSLHLYLDVSEIVALKHLRPHDTHAPITIQPGKYEVRRQREWAPEGWRRAAD